ncbi:hypothetical protein Pan161_18260 [Gimesia algae]|uniref:Helix-turn-helix domain protein n=1 Tax=Gimesia algae TaxID=2527971 RepID=A0A517VB10_9PLAN|nr:hypothetical protein Pan161_18260 [Gimesia algae]
MTNLDTSPSVSTETAYLLSIPVETLRPLIEDVLRSVDGFPGWPLGQVALEEKSAAICIGVKPHVLRDARLRLKLPHTLVGRTVTYTSDELKSSLNRMSVNH